MKNNKKCQSCGYPFKKDKKGGGTDSNGSISDQYCSMCYDKGEFLNPPEIDTAEKFQKYCIEEMKKDGMNGLVAWFLTRGIPKLERWQNQDPTKP
ncbi:zinc ribbon domain-containing protein [Patescibacteria group bacterium]|nr:zinc ribbon domain-containing protein [Patescibacteria group bacterium]